MSGIYIHKASNKYVVLSMALLLYVSFFCFLILFDGIPQVAKAEKRVSYAFEMNSDWNKGGIEDLISKLQAHHLNNEFLSYQLKDKDQEWARIKSELRQEEASNPLNHIIVVDCNRSLDKETISKIIKTSAFISSISLIEANNNTGRPSTDGIEKLLIPLILLIIVLYFSILQGATQSNLNSNKKLLENLVVSGAHHSNLSAVFRKNALSNVLVAAIIAVILFAATIYLINANFQLNIEDFSFAISLKSILIPTLLLFALHLMVVLWKVDKYIKSI